DGDGDVALVFVGSQASEEAEAVDERHTEIEDDGVRMAALRLAKPHLGGERRMHVVALEPEHPRERRGDPLVVVNDKYCGRRRFRHRRRHLAYCNRAQRILAPRTAAPAEFMLNLAVSSSFSTVLEALVSPILVRPVREQLEHDRIIRLLHSKWRRKYEAGMNP